jgi:hypothetical protein
MRPREDRSGRRFVWTMVILIVLLLTVAMFGKFTGRWDLLY